MPVAQRRDLPLDRLARDGRLVAKDLAVELGDTEDNVRRDLRELAAAGLYQRVYGGALPVSTAVADDRRRRPVRPRRAPRRRERVPTQGRAGRRPPGRHQGDRRGQGISSPRITRWLIDHDTRQAQPGPRDLERIGQLTPRETEIPLSVARGPTNVEISAQQHISLLTTKTHVGNLLTKLAARERVKLTITAPNSWPHACLTRPTIWGHSSRPS